MKDLTPWYTSFILGTIIVAIVATARFSRPTWYRTYTTEARFDLAQALFALTQMLVFFLVCLLELRIGTAMVVDSESDLWALVMLAPVLIAIAAVIVLPMIPWLDRWPRAQLQRVAGAPEQGLRLAQMLEAAEFVPSQDVDQETRSLLLHRGVDLTTECVAPAHAVRDQFVRATHLFVQMRAWSAAPRYAGFMAESRNDFDRLRQNFDHLSLKVARTFDHIERIGTVSYLLSSANQTIEETGAHSIAALRLASQGATSEGENWETVVRRLIADLLSELHEEIARFMQDARLLAARAVLTTEMTEGRRVKSLEKLGFRMQNENARPSYHVLVVVAAVIFATVWLFFAVLAAASPTATTSSLKLSVLSGLIAVIQAVALAVAVIPKTLWRFANSGLSGRTPWGFVFAAGCTAMVLAVALNVMTPLILGGDWGAAVKRIHESYPWWPAAFITASLTAFLIQDKRWAGFPLRSRRRLDVVVMGVGWCVTTIVGRTLMLAGGQHVEGGIAVMIASFGFSIVTGGLIGWIVPTTFRDTTASEGAVRAPLGARQSVPQDRPAPAVAH